MEGLKGVNFAIAFEGDSRYLEGDNLLPTSYIWAIDLSKCGENEICAVSMDPEGSREALQEGRLSWNVSNNGERVYLGSRIRLTPEYANTVSFTARIFESDRDWFGIFRRALGRIWGASSSSVRRDVPIGVSNRPDFKEGESYSIEVENNDCFGINASFVKLEEGGREALSRET